MNELLFYDLKDTAGVSPSLAKQVCRELGRRVVAGTMPEGSLIEDESRLAERYGVSRAVIREATKLLSGKGMLEVRRGIGTRVRRRASWSLLDDDVLAWHLSVETKPEFLRQLMDIRFMIEPEASAWAARHGSSEEHAEIRSAQERMAEVTGSVEEFVVADALFHRSILRAAGNEILLSMEGVIFSALLGSIRLTNAATHDNEKSIPFHRAVMVAIETRDDDAARTGMKLLLDDTHARLSSATDGFSRR